MRIPLTRRVIKSLSSDDKLRVLMYHSVSADGKTDDLTVSSEQLKQQWSYLRDEGYSPILLSELIAAQDGAHSLPRRPVLITFDDGFLDNIEVAYPLAKEYGMKINFFLVPAFIESGEYRGQPCAGVAAIRALDPGSVEIGLHSYAHSSYAELVPSRVAADLAQCRHSLEAMGISYQPCLAYPFGAYPKRKGYDQDRLFEILEEQGIRLGFRIGNRLNRIPFANRYLIQRLDIRGNDSFLQFQLGLSFGKKL